MTKLRAKQKTPDHQQQQIQRERQVELNRRLGARDVIIIHASEHGWEPGEAEQVISMLGLDKEPLRMGATTSWSGFNNGM